MNYPTHHHHPRQIERPDDDLPNAPMAPWPWQPPASGQARRAESQRLAGLVEVNHGGN
jgi:hypothetical protein